MPSTPQGAGVLLRPLYGGPGEEQGLVLTAWAAAALAGCREAALDTQVGEKMKRKRNK